MICEDESIIAQSLQNLVKKTILKKKKTIVNTIIAQNGVDCLYKLCNDYINGFKYEILLIDENMPFLFGSEVIKIIYKLISSKQLNNIKIYSITGNSNEEERNYLLKCGVRGIYNKPLNVGMIESILNEN